MSFFPIPPLLPLPRFTTHHYYVEIDSVFGAIFHECSGFGAKMQPERAPDGGNNIATRFLPTRISCNAVTMKYGVILLDQVWLWFAGSLNGRPERRTVVIHQYLNNGVFPGGMPMVSWRLHDCLPIEYTGPAYSSKGQAEVALESIKVQPSSMERL
jgi:phage tail-like protein